MNIVRLSGLTKADVAQSILHLQGSPYSLRDYPMFVDIYNSDAPRKLLRSGRQVSKTVTMAGDMLTDCVLEPYSQIIYANSSDKQTTGFSTSKLDPFLLHSPILYRFLMKSKHTINNVYNKRFSNMSEIRLTYFSEAADRIRGASAQKMALDEVQDMLIDAMIDAEECLSAAKNPKFIYSGTSKSLITPLEYLWEQSNQKEWIIPCEGCHKWNRPSMENIGKHGLICKKCGSPLNTRLGKWQAFAEPRSDGKPHYVDGFWVPQIIMPLHCESSSKWDKLLEKLETYPEYKFLNEVMGLPWGAGESPITEKMLRDMCIEELPMYMEKNTHNSDGASFIVAGIDWGGGGGSGTSRTVLSIYAVYPQRFEFVKIFGHIYGSGQPTEHVQDIAEMLRRFQVIQCYADHGGGNFAMSYLTSLVPGIRLVPVMYTEQAAPYRWDENAGRFTVNRTVMIDAFLNDVKLGHVRSMRWADFRQFAGDILNVKEEIIGEEQGKGKRVWRRYPSKPDDSLHSMVFGWFAARVLCGKTDMRIV